MAHGRMDDYSSGIPPWCNAPPPVSWILRARRAPTIWHGSSCNPGASARTHSKLRSRQHNRVSGNAEHLQSLNNMVKRRVGIARNIHCGCVQPDLRLEQGTVPRIEQGVAPPLKLSTGCAAGVTVAAATLRALLELIERDAVALWWRGGRRGRAIGSDDEAGRAAAELLAQVCRVATAGDRFHSTPHHPIPAVWRPQRADRVPPGIIRRLRHVLPLRGSSVRQIRTRSRTRPAAQRPRRQPEPWCRW
jgi:YcaO cyclodehydratase, ATP-ad Mg2+-binding